MDRRSCDTTERYYWCWTLSTPVSGYSGVVAGLELIEGFLNTVDERSFRRHGQSHVAEESLETPKDLSRWLSDHDLVPAGRAIRRADVEAAVRLRTELRDVLIARSEGATVGRDVLAVYPLVIATENGGQLRIASRTGRPWLDTIMETVAVSVARGEWDRMKLCAAADCRWAFYDTSRNGRGRWCDMNVCGNRHKTRTYRERHRRAAS